MTARLLGKFALDSPEWHEARVGLMTGSRIAAVLGLSPFESRFSLWHRMAGIAPEGQINTEMEWGTRLEDAIARKWADRHPRLRAVRTGTWVHGSFGWMGANPDRLVRSRFGRKTRAVLEVKAPANADGWGPDGSDEIPLYYLCQILWYCAVLGVDEWHCAALIRGSDYREYTGRADTEDAKRDILTMRGRAADFLSSIEDGDAPDVDAHSETYTVLRSMHPEIDPVDIDLDDLLDGDALLALAVDRAAKKAAWEQADLAAKNRFAVALGNAHRIRVAGKTIADRRAKSKTHTPYVQFATKLPEIGDTAA